VIVIKLNSAAVSEELSQEYEFEQPIATKQPSIFLQQPTFWSRGIVWGIVGITSFGLTWANIAEIEKVIPAQGQLEPQGAVKEVQAPIEGVISDVFVKDGDAVKANTVLMKFDMTSVRAQLASLEQIRRSVMQENQFYRSQIGSDLHHTPAISGLKLPPEILMLIENRAAVVADNQVYLSQIKESTAGLSLNVDQQARFLASKAELNSRVDSHQAEVRQLQSQLAQTTIQLADARAQLINEQTNLASARKNFATEQQILNDMESIVNEGAIPMLQYRRQKQAVIKGQAQVNDSQGKISTNKAEIDRLLKEQERLEGAIAQAKAQLTNTVAVSKNELQEKIAFNQQKIADIDSQLGKLIVENDKKVSEVDSQIGQLKQNLKYHEIKAPVSGTIFELKAHPGSVSSPTQTVVEIVPNDSLMAQVYITNKDRGFVQEGMTVDIRLDSFDFSEFGDIKGKLISIGADALEPDTIHPYYRFPAKIKLDQQFINVKGKKVSLESGMSVSVNIKERKRKVISIFTGFLAQKLDTLKQTK
jgi:hemolysin D